jgi:hypothetical protein
LDFFWTSCDECFIISKKLHCTAGLVVLRVAEVAQFQEKILRAILNGDLTDVVVTPQQM